MSLAMLDLLLDHGVDTVFGIPGSTISPLFDSALDRPKVRVVTPKHETAAAFMAAAWARVTDRVGCVWATSGPGVLNALNGVASAYCDGLPLVLIAGEVPRAHFGRGALQEGGPQGLDVLSIYRPVTKMAAQVPNGATATALLHKALTTAQSGRRGPVLLTLPVDVGLDRVEPRRLSVPLHSTMAVDDEACEQVAAQLRYARRPLIFAGSGARGGRGPVWLRRLAEALGCPVMTTPKAKGLFPESHELSLGVFGHAGHPRPHAYLKGGVDALLIVGCGLSDTATSGWASHLQPSGCLMQVDIDPAHISRNYDVSLGLVGDSGAILERVVRAVEACADAGLSTKRRASLRAFLAKTPRWFGAEGREARTSPLHPARAVVELQAAFPADTVYASDIGEHMAFAVHHLTVDAPDGFCVSTGLGSMGSGVGSAIGMQLALGPERRVVAICGDGGALMHGGEIATCVSERLPVVFAVFNDRRLNMVYHGGTQVYGRSQAFDHPDVDFAKMADAMGAIGVRIERPGQLAELDVAALAARRLPIVLDIAVDPAQRLPVPSARCAVLKHFGADAKPSRGSRGHP